MPQTNRFAGVLPKIGAARSRLLGQNKLHLLTETKNLAEFVVQLHESTYQSQIAKNPPPVTSRKLERAFTENLIETYIKIIRSTPIDVKDFLKLYLFRFEVENLKVLIKAVNARLSSEQKMSKMYLSTEAFFRRSALFEEAARVDDLSKTVDTLKGTEYELPLKMGLESYEEDGTTACFDVLLDKHFYDKLYKAYFCLPKKEKPHAFYYISMASDWFTLQVLLRGKNLQYNPDWLRLAAPTKKFHLNKEQIEDIIAAPDFDSAFRIAQASFYAPYIGKANTPEEILANSKRAIDKAMFLHAKVSRVSEVFNVGAVLSFFTQKEAEVRNLTAACLGVESAIKPEDIRSRFIV